jgi:DNA primase
LPRLSAELRSGLAAAAQHFSHVLLNDPGASLAASYLHGRGIERDAAEAFALGMVDDSIPDYADYAGWICIPYLTLLGGVVGLKFRHAHECVDCEYRYMTPVGQAARPYNTLALDEAEEMGLVGVAEGELDALIATFYCGIPTVGIPGVPMWKAHPEICEMLRGFPRVIVFEDHDDAGSNLVNRICRDIDVAHRVAMPPGAKDVNAAYVKYGAETIREIAGVPRS